MMELREKIEMAIQADVATIDSNGNFCERLVGVTRAADAILAIPEIAEALAMMHAIRTMPEGVVLTAAPRDWVDDSPPKASPTHP